MELNFKIIVLMLSILLTGLTAGLCFTWSNAVTPGIGRLDDLGFLKAFQAMNRAIINPSFLIVFMGPSLLLFVNALVFKNSSQFTFTSYLVAAILFFTGVGLVTIFKNVPLNEILDKTVLETASNVELTELRKTFEKPWNRWHMIRTVCSFTAFALLVIGMLFNK
jgi:uncharacterized membrane protein